MAKTLQIEVTGMKEVRRAIREIEDKATRKGLAKELRSEWKQAADIVAETARRFAPSQSGALRKTVKGKATQTGAAVKAGGARVPYAAAQEYGRRYPNGRKSSGRFYLWRAVKDEATIARAAKVLDAGLTRFARRAVNG